MLLCNKKNPGSVLLLLVYGLSFTTFAIAPAAQSAAQNLDQKIAEGLNLRQFEATLKKWTEKGFVPIDAEVVVNRDRPTFSLRLLKPDKEMKWDVRSDLTDEKFRELHDTATAKNYRLICHKEYEIKGESRHLCIWHFDKDFVPPRQTKKMGEEPRPPAIPLKSIWNSTSNIPFRGKAMPEFGLADKVILDFIRVNQIPGASLAVSYKGKLLCAKGYGYSDLATKSVLKPNQPMRICELTRPITAVAILQLVDQEKLKLTDRVFDILDIKPDDPGKIDPNLNRITIANLLHDTGGFNPETGFPAMKKIRTIAGNLGVEHPVNQQQIIRYMMSQSLSFEPGNEVVKSDFGYCLLGRVIEAVSGLSYGEYVQKNVFQPLKIKSMSLARGPIKDRAKNEVHYYEREGAYWDQLVGDDIKKWVQLPDGGINFEVLDSGEGWVGTPSDVLVFASDVRGKRSRLLSQNAINQMFSRPIYLPEIGPDGKVVRKYYGCGWNVTNNGKKGLMSWHYGSNFGSSAMLICESSQFSWVVCFNTGVTVSGSSITSSIYSPLSDALDPVRKKLGL